MFDYSQWPLHIPPLRPYKAQPGQRCFTIASSHFRPKRAYEGKKLRKIRRPDNNTAPPPPPLALIAPYTYIYIRIGTASLPFPRSSSARARVCVLSIFLTLRALRVVPSRFFFSLSLPPSIYTYSAHELT